MTINDSSENNIINNRSHDLWAAVFSITIILTILSQILAIQSYLRIPMFLCWIFLAFISIMNEENHLVMSNYLKSFIFIFCIFALISMVASLFIKGYLNNYYLKTMLIPMGATYIGGVAARKQNFNLEKFVFIYFVSSLILAMYLQITYFTTMSNWLSTYEYVYSSKNSAAQVLSSSVIIGFFYLKKKHRFLYIAGATFMILVTFLLRCRTAILGIVVCILLYIMFHSKNRLLLLSGLIGAILIMLQVPVIQSSLEHFIQLDAIKSGDLNAVSSNRFDLWADALKLFCSSPILGVGKYYVDCSYLMILASNGIIGFLLIEFLWMKRIILNLKLQFLSNEKVLLILMTAFYFIASLLEGLPPFGPGACSFMFWLISEYIFATEYQKISE